METALKTATKPAVDTKKARVISRRQPTHAHQDSTVADILRASRNIQTKLKIGQPGDRYEQEADRVAEQVVSGSMAGAAVAGAPAIRPANGTQSIQRMCEECEEELQLKPKMNETGSTVGTGTIQAPPSSAGRKLPVEQRGFFESRMGHGFEDVRIHTDDHAARSAETIHARAFTLGRDIVFNKGQYRPGTLEGDKLLAHELTHVIQQRGGLNPSVQRSCFDGNCEDCDEGWRSLWVTVFFARRANRVTMEKLRNRINKAKEILGNCCVNLKFDFNWTLIPGAASIETASRHARPAGDPLGLRDVPEPQETIGEGDLIASARGIPLLIVDEIQGTGGGTTILGGQDDRGNEYDVEYTGPSMFFMAVNQPREGACSRDDLTIAHELWHVTGALRHDAADGAITECSGEGVAEPYCTRIRGLT
ncbi:MAG: DUF4157 domain-containing protein [Burkholderiales bacterium]|nr:DUF4157 domain-containing protein [Nitrosomonas sp.]MCP5274922.1 DUF4157 domain-containing protein [Burkholderiales bacterium]